MRTIIEKAADTLGVFSPMIILFFSCAGYMITPEEEMVQTLAKNNPAEKKIQTVTTEERSTHKENTVDLHPLPKNVF